MANPIAAYNFDETSGSVLDVTGNGNDFTVSGDAVRTASGHTNGGLEFAGAGSAGPTVKSPALGQSTDRTVMCWLKLDSTPGIRWAAFWEVVSIGSGSWGIVMLFGDINIQARNSSGFARATATAPTDAAWHHVAGTYVESTGVITLYLDGVSAGTNTITGPLRTDADNLILGSADTEPFTLDDFRVYDTALTGPEVVTAMNTPVTGTTTVTSDLDLRWAVRSSVVSDLDLRWAVRSSVTSDLDARWAVRSSVVSDLDLRWAVRSSVASDLDARWAVRSILASDLDARWAVRSSVASDLDLRWAVQESADQVSSDLDLRWAVRSVVSSDLDLRWRVDGLGGQVTSDLTLFWEVLWLIPETRLLAQWSLAAETREWLGPIVILVDDNQITDFQVAFTEPGQRPTLWSAPNAVGGQKGILVGTGTDYPLAAGRKYNLWVTYADVPEAPVLRCGEVRVY